MPTSNGPDLAVQHYYACFNERRLAEAAGLFSDDAVLQLLLFERLRGAAGHLQFAQRWIEAFPDARMHVNRLQVRGETLCEVDVTATGTHLGTLEMGAYRFTPSGCAWSLDLRQLFEFRDGRIVFSSLSLDIHEFIRQLAPLDLPGLKRQLERIRRLSEELDQIHADSPRLRDITQRLGAELDAARKVLRPYFYK
jgi:ketosteroid isomerase-like protein